jgi:hypothetical protein
MGFLRNISVDTLHKGDPEEEDNDDDDDNKYNSVVSTQWT